MNTFIISIPNDDKKEREIREFEVDFKTFFCWRSNLSRSHEFLSEI